ncbi:MAG: RNA polymerase sigma factor [Microthrixaceae bacterium]
MKDEAGFTRLFMGEYPSLVRELTLIVGSRHVAEEVAADAFEQTLRQWKVVSSYERPGAWVRKVALRIAGRTGWRTRHRRLVERSALQPMAFERDPEVDLLAALALLPMSQRTAVVLHHMAGFPAREIGEVLGCSEVTVRTHLHRGRARLGELLGDRQAEVEVTDADGR